MAYPTPKVGVLAAFVIGFAGFVVGGCQKNYDKALACSSNATCAAVSGMKTDFQLPAATCCGGFCVAPVTGCDSGLRYITTTGFVGDCVDIPACGLDMAVAGPPPIDFSSSNADM